MSLSEKALIFQKLYYKEDQLIWYREFKTKIYNILKDKVDNPDENLYFAVMSNAYFCDYRPRYPEKTAGDINIFYDWISKDARIYGNLYSAIPTIVKYDSFAEMCDALEYIEF